MFAVHIEGTDAAGKSEFSRKLVKTLNSNSPRIAILAPEFSLSALGDMFRDQVKRRQFISLGDPLAQALALTADHTLKANSIDKRARVQVFDRGQLSIAAYEGIRLEADPNYGNKDWSEILWPLLRITPLPNLVVILTAPEKQLVERLKNRGDKVTPRTTKFIIAAQERIISEATHLPPNTTLILDNRNGLLDQNLKLVNQEIRHRAKI